MPTAKNPDPGTHAAAEWLLRTWGLEETRLEADRELPNSQQEVLENPDPRGWYLDAERHHMVILDAGGFVRGAPTWAPRNLVTFRRTEPDRPRHKARIDRRFAIASKEVTRAQFARFQEDQSRSDARHAPNPISPDDHCPQNFVSWYQAAAYCHWLSHQAGIAASEWAYIPNEDGEYAEGMRTSPRFPACLGYRRPKSKFGVVVMANTRNIIIERMPPRMFRMALGS